MFVRTERLATGAQLLREHGNAIPFQSRCTDRPVSEATKPPIGPIEWYHNSEEPLLHMDPQTLFDLGYCIRDILGRLPNDADRQSYARYGNITFPKCLRKSGMLIYLRQYDEEQLRGVEQKERKRIREAYIDHPAVTHIWVDPKNACYQRCLYLLIKDHSKNNIIWERVLCKLTKAERVGDIIECLLGHLLQSWYLALDNTHAETEVSAYWLRLIRGIERLVRQMHVNDLNWRQDYNQVGWTLPFVESSLVLYCGHAASRSYKTRRAASSVSHGSR